MPGHEGGRKNQSERGAFRVTYAIRRRLGERRSFAADGFAATYYKVGLLPPGEGWEVGSIGGGCTCPTHTIPIGFPTNALAGRTRWLGLVVRGSTLLHIDA